LNVDPKTVTNVGNAYTEDGLDSALFDEDRSGRPIDFDDRERSRIVAMVCSTPPRGFYRWTLDLIVEEAQKRELVDGTISRETIRVILKEHDLKPWQEKMWCIGDIDEEYIRRMEDVLDVYQRPYNEAFPVVCIDEKPVALFSDATPRLSPRGPGEAPLPRRPSCKGETSNLMVTVVTLIHHLGGKGSFPTAPANEKSMDCWRRWAEIAWTDVPAAMLAGRRRSTRRLRPTPIAAARPVAWVTDELNTNAVRCS
jgi:transposase